MRPLVNRPGAIVRSVRLAVSGAHGTGKTSLVAELCELLPGHEGVPEPYEVLEEHGYKFGLPPTVEDYRAQLDQAMVSLRLPVEHLVFDRTPLDFLAYLKATGCEVEGEASTDALVPLFASLDALIVLPVTAEMTDRLPAPELPALQDAVNNALLMLVYDDPLNAWSDVPILELDGPLDGRTEHVLQLLDGLRST
jgi:hypothetical protein